MKKIGLTGGIGAGKSYIAGILLKLGYPVFFSDQVAKEITANDDEVRTALIRLFGDEVFQEKVLNRTFLAQQIFQNPVKLKEVNQIIHPKVRKAFDNWSTQQNSALVFNEAAILFETGAYQQFDATVLVVAPKELKIKRVLARENITEQQVHDRMDKQWTDEQKMPLADFTIENNEQKPLLQQVLKLIDFLNA